MASQLGSLMERRRGAPARGLQSGEAVIVPLPPPVSFVLCSGLSPSPQYVDEELQSSLQEKSPVSRAGGREGCAQPCSSRAVQGSEHSSLKSADVVRHAQAKACSNSLIIKIPGSSSG